jgi:nucleoside-diphosphate-sugar epimerase
VTSLVTGATGFIGSHLVDALGEGGQTVAVLVRSPDGARHLRERSGVTVVAGDLTDRPSLARALRDVEVVYHCAGKVSARGDPHEFHRVNVEGTENLLTCCTAAGVRRLVYLSSAVVVMSDDDRTSVDVSSPYPDRFLHPYPASKALAERLVRGANGRGDLTTVSLRPCWVWGPRDHTILREILSASRRGLLVRVGDGRNRIATSYVRSVVHAALLSAVSDVAAGKVYFVTDAEEVELWPFLREILDAFGMTLPRLRLPFGVAHAVAVAVEKLWGLGLSSEIPPLSRFVVELVGRSLRARSDAIAHDLGYRPVVSVERGLEEFRAWARTVGNLDEFLAAPVTLRR